MKTLLRKALLVLIVSSGCATISGQNSTDYTLPDPLLMEDGREIKTSSEWTQIRRPEILESFENNVYGKAPKPSKDMHFSILTEDKQALGGKATRKEVAVYFTKSKDNYMTVLLYIPNQRNGRVPIFFGLNFDGNHAVSKEEGVAIVRIQSKSSTDMPTIPARGAESSRWPIEMLIENGYGLATVYRGDIDPDYDDGFRNGVHPLFYSNGQEKPEADEWGTVAAWAFGLSCAMNYFEVDKDIDAKQVAVIGHSRLGKATLWAGAIDERFAMVISNDSGCGGAALSRRKIGETVSAINKNFPYWFCDNFKQFNDREDFLPVDQHQLIALIAPRPVYVASAEEDQWADPEGEFLSAYHASPVYELFGLKGLPKEMPKLSQPEMQGHIGYHIRPGKHDITGYDWEQYIKFADKFFKK
ncbi:MAG: acetylxylan esterase [Prevotella sp.]|jgi:hypothetical protein|nr:acetylxylan esterase [Prevotella sp.]